MIAKRKGRPPRYPWDEWFKRKRAFQIVRHKDFKVTLHSMISMIRNKANQTGRSASVIENGNTLTVQFKEKGDA